MLLASLVAASPAIADGNTDGNKVRQGPVPEWVVPSDLLPVPEDASGLMFMRRQDMLAHLDDKGQANYFGYRVKILHSNALQLGNLSIAWNPAVGAPTVHVIKVHRGNETIDVLKTTSFEILRREHQLETAMLDGMLTAVLRVPDLRVGDELEFGATTWANDPTLGTDNAGMLFLGPSPAPGRYRLELSWANGHTPAFRMTPDMTAIARNGDRKLEFRFDNPAPLSPPKDAPIRYQRQRIVEYSDFADWPAVSRRFAALYAKSARFADNSPLKREAARIAATHADPLDRARAALKLVQQDVRYVYVGLNGGNLTPATADETWQRRYGDCKGKTSLLLGLLAELGIPAEAVLANNGGGDEDLDQRLPGPQLFDHVLVRAQIGGTAYWLDGTLPPVAPPDPAPVIPYNWFLPLTAQGSTIENRPWRPASRPDEIAMFDIDARAGFDQPAPVTSTTIIRGIKGLQQQFQLSGLAPDQLLSAFRQKLVGGNWDSVDGVKWRYDQKAQASVLTVSGTWTVDWDDEGVGSKSLILPGGGFNPPERRARPAGQDQKLPYYSMSEFTCHVTTVRLPSTTKAEDWSTRNGFDVRYFGRNYYRAFDVRYGSVRMVRGARTERRETDAETARQDNGRIPSFDNSMGVITYSPIRRTTHDRNAKLVPTTDGIDWTADSVPCLSTATVR